MPLLKRISISAFVLIICLFLFLFNVILICAEPKKTSGVFEINDRNEDLLLLKWYKVNDLDTFLTLREKILPVMAEAFADEERDFLLDDKLQIRPEYAEIFEKLPQDSRELFNASIAIARYENREERVRATLQRYKQKWNDGFVQDLVHKKPLVVIAENVNNKILGFILACRKHPEWQIMPEIAKQKNIIWGEILGIVPDSQGRGLTRPLALSILKIMPKTTRIIFGTLSWNTKAQKIYEWLGAKRITDNEPDSLPSDCYYEYVVKD